ncbi:UDP-N-acetylenolpyruvoylglucosamine reductase [Candidatus Williamhamiltonella defendens]|uniref:UDP-N-acetylenolpyruvoylglucosamine reductase n=1 Tax=Candidatus Williamhamiltonella defendens TaxID=138072 RepID=A0A2D3T880_9ENTR|nr:UDP-N-acetylmuramate dehydrogenase [Candidatus Hamiltonella defensa]ATW30024.1 UDP-N-acetylenolpyruvoylglucosamine reductase [Candidatus Hamiltonella defensa]ATW31997.1 UDP-N-acetylenolpyruvoylglucosamine reductase [Candidatus Hamiltonella defensa]ATW33927.1 UDP-N-acetylenolpyruvoylglucosamine reductase [Candidatus Hamiltonella defensa]
MMPLKSLKHLNTFSIPAHAVDVISVDSVNILIEAFRNTKNLKLPFIFLGSGSNVLFLEDFLGVVLLNQIKGLSYTESETDWHLHVGAGENWHELVCYTLQHNILGLENLALIPGSVGAAPIQNIGAYGVEFDQICEYVDLLDPCTADCQRLSRKDCRFGYRDSIFKHYYKTCFVIAVGIKLKKCWVPKLDYGDLKKLDPFKVTAKEIFDFVCAIRRNKLPNPLLIGNAGSFFKNPQVDRDTAALMIKNYPDLVYYPQADGTVKLAAGWLIDQCHLKGYTIGGAAVHDRQALVLINKNHASSQDILDLARHVYQKVAFTFSVYLEPEVRFISAEGEINPMAVLS